MSRSPWTLPQPWRPSEGVCGVSIASEVERISANVRNTIDAIEQTGVTVPEGATSDNLPALARALANEKQNKLTGAKGQVVGFDSSGNAVAQAAPSGLPEGGAQGQLLAKGASGAEWVDNPTLAFGPQAVPTTAWASDSTYPDYPYRASIALPGVTASHIPSVNFTSSDALSGKLSPVSESYDGGVYIYASGAFTAEVDVGSITCIKAVGA